MLLNKKAGNISRSNATNLTNSNNLASQAGRQASTSLPLGKAAIHLKQAGRQVLSFPLGKEATYTGAGRQAGTPQATAHLPLGEGSSSSQATAHLPPREGSSISHATAHLPPQGSKQFPPAIAHLPSWQRKQFIPSR